MTNYGNDILAERSRKRMSQGALSERTGVFVQTIVDIENDRIGVDEATYGRFLAAIREESNAQEAA
jgi:transcriptional regulator with XRE-family HTH domain